MIWRFTLTTGETTPAAPSNLAWGIHADMNYNGIKLSTPQLQTRLASAFGSAVKIARCPGAIANKYNWVTGEADSGSPYSNTLADWYSIYTANGYDILFVLNMVTHSKTDQLNMLAAAAAMGIPIKYIEFGNEPNILGSTFHAAYPTAAAYAAACADWIADIKAIYPDVLCVGWGENKGWCPEWLSVISAIPGLDAVSSHIGPSPEDFIIDGEINYFALESLIINSFVNSGLSTFTALPIWITEINYNDNPSFVLSDANARKATAFILQKVAQLINANNDGFKMICVRRMVGTEAIIKNDFTLGPTGLAMQDVFNASTTTDLVGVEIDEPVGWDALSMVLQRDPDWHGVAPQFSANNLQFHDDAYFILKDAYQARGIDGDIGVRIEWKCDDCENFSTFFEGKIDFGRYDEECGEDDCYIIAGIEDDSPQTLLKNRQDTDVDLTKNIAYDGSTVLTDYAALGIDIELPGKKLQFVSQATKSAASSYDVTADAEFPEPDISDTGLVQGAFVPGLDKTVLNELNDFTPSAIDDFYYPWVADITAVGSVLTIAASAENIQCSGDIAIEGRFKGTIHYNGDASRDLHVSLDVKEITPDNVINDRFASLVVNQTAEINSDHDYPIDVSFSFTVPNVPVGTRYWFQLFINTLISTTGTRQLIVDTDIETYFKANIASLCDPTPCKNYLIHEAASRVVESITNNTLKFKSEYFGRTDSQPYAFSEDGCGGLRSITNGLQLRRALLSDGSNPNVFTSWSKMLASLNACDLIGFDVNGSDVRAEPVKFFYNDTIVFVCDGVNKYSKKIKTDRIWNQFNFGFEKYETESTNGLDAQHTKRQYRIPIEKIDAVLEKLCKYILDGYAIEVTRRKFGTSEDWRYDQDIFMFCLERAESDFEVEQGNIDSPANMYDAATVINYRLTPVRNALRWFKWLMQGKRPIDAALTKMLFNSGDGNYVAKGLLQGSDCVMEAAAIAENDPLFENAFADINQAIPFIVPEEVSFIFPLGLNEFKYLKENIYGKIQYRRESTEEWKFGWIQKLEPHHEDGDATFTLVSAVSGTAVENPPIYIIEETDPIITTEQGEGLIIE